MWPFNRNIPKTASTPSDQVSFSQVDTTEGYGDNEGLSAESWVTTKPLNSLIEDGQSMGLPGVGTSDDDVYRIAARLSLIRESMLVPNDGVYCPVCHLANVTLDKLRTPCPKCGRELLRFGWD